MSVPAAPQIEPRPWAEDDGTSITFYWNPPYTDGGSPITSYTLACDSIAYSQTLPPTLTSYTATGFTAGQDLTFTIIATNAIASSAPAQFRTVQAGVKPFGPTAATASTFNTSTALVTWTGPSTIQNEGASRWFLITTLPSTTAIASTKKSAYIYERARTLQVPSTNYYYQYLVQSINDAGYCPPFAFTSTLGFGIIPPEFSPSSISSMALWFDAADPTSYTVSGSNVLTWNDKSGNNRNTVTKQGTITFTTSTVGNLNTLVFSAGAFRGPFSYTGASTTSFIVLRSGTNDGNRRFLSLGNSAENDYTNTNYYFIGHNGSGNQAMNYRNGVGPTTGQTILTTQYYLYTGGYNGTSSFISVNGSNRITSNSSGNFNHTSYALGANVGNLTDSIFSGNMGEVLHYNRSVDPFNSQKAEGYLAWKWRLQGSLPSTHLFKDDAPTSATVFSPSLYGLGMQLWLDVSDATTFTFSSGSTISQWRDKSSNLKHANGGTGTIRVSTFNGRSVVDTTQLGILSTPVISYTNYSSFCVAVVACRSLSFQQLLNATPTNTRITYFDNGGSLAVSGGPGASADAGQLGSNFVNINGGRAALNISTLSNVHILSFPINSSNTGFYIGGASNNTNNFRGHIYEMMVFTPRNTNSPYGTQDISMIEGYMAWRWGLQGLLPTTHEYKTFRPT